jgi:hypothetical protein
MPQISKMILLFHWLRGNIPPQPFRRISNTQGFFAGNPHIVWCSYVRLTKRLTEQEISLTRGVEIVE